MKKDYDKKIYSRADVAYIIQAAIKDAMNNKNRYIELNGYAHEDVLQFHDVKISTLSTLYHYFDC